MSLYFVLANSILLLAVFFQKNKKSEKLYLILIYLEIVLISGLRAQSVGTDTAIYVQLFNNYTWGNETLSSERYEIGYKILITIIHFFTNNPQYLIFISSLIIYTGIFLFVYYNSNNYVISLYLFTTLLFLSSLNTSRQFIAMAIGVNCYTALKNKKKYLALFLVIIAMFFHKTAGVYIFVIILYYLRPTLRINFLITLLLSLAFLFKHKIISLVTYLAPQYRFYLLNNLYHNETLGGRLTYVFLIIALFSMLTLYCVEKKNNSGNKNLFSNADKKNIFECNLLIAILMLGIFFGFLAKTYALLNRVSEYFYIFSILLIPEIIYFYRKIKHILFFIIIIIMQFYMYVVLSVNQVGVLPYDFFF